MVDGRGRGGDPDEFDDLPSEEDIARFGDVTQTCPECGKEVFDDTEICYHCGHALSTAAGSAKSGKWVVATVVVIVAAFVLVAVLRVF